MDQQWTRQVAAKLAEDIPHDINKFMDLPSEEEIHDRLRVSGHVLVPPCALVVSLTFPRAAP